MVSFWLIMKGFKEKSSQVKIVTLAIILFFTNFTFLFILLGGWNNLYILTSLLVLTIIASSSILLHLTKNVEYEVALLKALGGKKLTILTSFFIELAIIATVGSFIGGFIGIGLFFSFSYLTNHSPLIITESTLSIILFPIVFSIIISSFLGVIFAWGKSNKPIVEGMMHAK